MIKTLSLAVALSLAIGGAAEAKTCRDASGKFAKCPAAAEKTRTAKTEKGAKTEKTEKAEKAEKAAPARTASTGGGLLDRLRRREPGPAPAATTSGRAASATAPAGPATARCKDGTLSYSRHRSGTCAGHGGVAQWLAPMP